MEGGIVYLGLKFLEILGLGSGFRTDSLIGLVNYNKNPELVAPSKFCVSEYANAGSSTGELASGPNP